MRTIALHLTLSLFSFFYSYAAHAQVEFEAGTRAKHGQVLVAKFSEQISPGDYEAFLRGLREYPGHYDRKIALLDSIGGSSAEAMRIGRLLRETGFDTLVPSNAICQGSCIYLLAAGKRRMTHGHIGLHRPHFSAGESAQSSQAGLPRNSAAYLRQMGVSSQLFNDMQRIEPSRMRLLSHSDLIRYRLN